MRKGRTYKYVRVNSTLSFILTSIKQFKFYVIGLFVTSTIWSIDVSLGPYLLKIMVDRVEHIDHRDVLPALSGPLLFYILLLIAVFIVSRLDDFIWLKLRPNLQKYIGINLMKRMMSHSAYLYQNHFAVSLVNKINDVTSGIPDILRICIHQFFGNVLALVIASYALYQTNSKFAAVFIFWGGTFIVISFKLSATASNLSKRC
jgi:ATP-binding cassette subfamily B protein